MTARTPNVDSQYSIVTTRREFMRGFYSVAEELEFGRKSPEDWLQSSEPEKVRGRFKVFLGYAPGVGKTFSMLSEGIRRRSRGEDVVIGIVETHGRSGTAEQAAKLEQIPRRMMEYKGTVFGEMDVDAILARCPQVVLVDELAHTNIEGSRFSKRYEDVLFLLDNKIDVLSTVNIQHIESLTPRVQALTGVIVREQVPDWVLDKADEIVISDVTPEALVTRMRRGDIYPVDRVERSLANFFRRGNLIALREMALHRVARAVDRTLEEYVKRKRLGPHWAIAEKIAVCISAGPQARDLIARGARLAEALDAEFYVLHVADKADDREESKQMLESSLVFARHLGAQVVALPAGDTAKVTAAFIREQRITQAIVGRSATHGLRSYLYYYALQKFMAEAPHVDLHIVTWEEP
jgi:two-component system sensor histidine kinase KdpD